MDIKKHINYWIESADNDFNLEVRYSEYKREFYKICTKNFTDNYFLKIQEFAKWLKSQITY